MSDKPIERSCDTCEHEYDSSNEYCGACDDVTSQWKEAGWHRYESSSKQIVELQAEKKKLQENLGVWRAACGINEKRIEELQAEAKAKNELLEVFQKDYKRLSIAEDLSCTQEWFNSEVQLIATHLFEALKGNTNDNH